MSDFLDRIAAILALAPFDEQQAPRPADESLLRPPMAELCNDSRSFAEVYGQNGHIFTALASESGGKPALAAMLEQLETALGEGLLSPPWNQVPQKRLGRFVYPII